MFSREAEIYNQTLELHDRSVLSVPSNEKMSVRSEIWLHLLTSTTSTWKERRKEISVVLPAFRRSRAACWLLVWVWVKLCCVDAEGSQWASLLWTLLHCLSPHEHLERCEWRSQGWTSGAESNLQVVCFCFFFVCLFFSASLSPCGFPDMLSICYGPFKQIGTQMFFSHYFDKLP